MRRGGAGRPWTTIDRELQAALQGELRRGARDLHAVRNAAAVLIENDTCAIRAYAGGLDYFSAEGRGQVDCARAVRSPGSALKPFVYALAHERRLLAPDERLADIPLARGSYSPVNFDEAFRGLVPAPEALAASLNLPAVCVLERIGAPAAADNGYLPVLVENPTTPETRTLAREEADDALRRDWSFQAGGAARVPRGLQEIAWARDLAARIRGQKSSCPLWSLSTRTTRRGEPAGPDAPAPG